jgi:hypothetical protein
LLPALETLLLDEHLVDVARARLGDIYGHRMLRAFADARDYDAALKLAGYIRERLGHTRFHSEAVRLLDELPRRRDDFKEFRLPTPEEWAAEKKRLTRGEQINYLCRRLRLLNCYQHSQPGGIRYRDHQYAEPHAIDGPKTEVINPYVELLGSRGEFRFRNEATSAGLGLTEADVRFLAEHLRDDWYMPSVSFWRNFHPQRQLHRTRPLVAKLVNEVAASDLCGTWELDAMTPEERDRKIEYLRQWGESRATAQVQSALVWAERRAVVNVALTLGVLTTLALLARKAFRMWGSTEPQGQSIRPPSS